MQQYLTKPSFDYQSKPLSGQSKKRYEAYSESSSEVSESKGKRKRLRSVSDQGKYNKKLRVQRRKPRHSSSDQTASDSPDYKKGTRYAEQENKNPNKLDR